ncbi:hypothetical protein J6590_036919 [Homalodisca vitripennis]|nr:hypothetical protein J6590_036919 [Homalodisca vitripennis]
MTISKNDSLVGCTFTQIGSLCEIQSHSVDIILVYPSERPAVRLADRNKAEDHPQGLNIPSADSVGGIDYLRRALLAADCPAGLMTVQA